jgi:nucleotide-binding universal stress UspA family protein
LTVAEHAPCPVAVIRPATLVYGPLSGYIVVGVDGSPASRAALEFGFMEANTRHVPLAVVHVPTYDALEREFAASAYDIFTENPSRALISAMLQALAPRYPTVSVIERVTGRSPSKDLSRISVGAELLVVGARGRGGFAGMLLGSVSHAMMRHAPCPVVVVPPVESDQQTIGRRVAAGHVAG